MADTQINVGAKLDGSFETTTNTAKRKIGEIGTAARDAGKGTSSIGEGMDSSAKKVEAATKNMVGSIQRQIAALEAGDKSSRQYQESLARMRGIDTAALKPYLDQLDAAKAKQEAAADSMKRFGAIGREVGIAVAGAVAGIGLFVKSTIDAADNLNDMSQRLGIAVKDLAKYELATSQSGASMETWAKGMKAMAVNLTENGDALKKAGITATDVNGAMKQFADVFASMPDGIEKTTLATTVFKKAGVDLIPTLNLGSEGLEQAAKKAEKFAEQMAIMAPLADAYNDNVAEIGMNSKAAGMSIMNDLLPGIVSISRAMSIAAQDAGILKAAWVGLGGIGWELIFKPAKVIWLGFNNTINEANASLMKFFGKTKEANDLLAMVARNNKEILALTSENDSPAAPKAPSFDKAKWMADYKAIQAALGGDGNKAAAAAKKALDEQNKALAEQSKLLAELSGYTGDYEKSAQRLVELRSKRLLTEEAYNRAITDLVNKQPAMAAGLKLEEEALKANAKARKDAMDAQEKSTKTAQDALAKQLESNAAIGLSKEALAELESATILANAAELERQANLQDGVMRSPDIIDGLKREAQAMRDLATAKVTGAQKQAGVDAADQMAKDQKKAAEESGKYWEDALMRAFESGKGFFQSLWDAIKNTLKTQVLKVTVQGVMGTLGLGASGAAMASPLGMAGDAAGMAGFGSNVISGLGLAATGFGQAAAATFSNGLIAGFSTNMANVGALASGGSWMTALGAAAPYLAIGAAVIKLIAGNKKTPTQGTGQAALTYDPMGNVTNTSAKAEWGGLSDLASGVITTMSSSYFATAKQLGITAAEATFGFGGNTGKESKGANFALSSSANGVSYSGSNNNSQSYTPEQLQLEASRAVFTALQASELPGYLSGLFDNITASTATQEQIDGVLAYGNALAGLNRGLMAMPTHFQQLATLSYEATQGLIGFSGGLENLQTNLGTYYTNFYSAEEQRTQTIRNITNALNEAGASLTENDVRFATREQFRAIVEAQDLTTESGQRTYAALISVAGAFAGLTPVLESVDTVLEKLIETASESKTSLIEKYTPAITLSDAKAQFEFAPGLFEQLMSKTAEEFASTLRTYVASLDPLTQSGRDAIEQVERLTPALDVMATSIGNATTAAETLTATNRGIQDQIDVLSGIKTETEISRANALRDATDDSTKSLLNTLYVLQDAKTAQDEYNTALAKAERRMSAASNALESAQNAVDSVRDRATSAYINAQDAVQSAQQRIASLQTASIREAAQAAYDSAQKIRDLGKSLREFVENKTITPDKNFAAMLTKAMGGDQQAMQGLSGAATAASDNAALTSLTSADARLAQARIMSDVLRVANMAEATRLPAVMAAEDQMVAATADLAKAQADMAAAYTVANAIGAGTTQSVVDLLGQYQTAQTALVAAQTEFALSQQLLEAIKTNTADTNASVLALGNALTVELAITAQSEITKLITVIGDTTGLTPEQKALALLQTQDITKTITAVAGSDTLTEQQKQLALITTTDVTKTISTIAGSTLLSEQQKSLALLTTSDITKSINTAVGQTWLTGTDLNLVLQASSSVTKTFNAALGSADATAIQLATAAASTVIRTISAAGGTLTADQRAILTAAAGTSTLDVAVTTSGTATFQPDNALQSVFDNISASNDLLAKLALQQLVMFSGVDWQQNPNTTYGVSRTDLSQSPADFSSLYHMTAQTGYQASMTSYLENISDKTTSGVRIVFDRGTSAGGSVYAQGGAFSNGIVSKPTYFNQGLMGEAGPEAIMPLTNINGSLGVRFAGNSANDTLVTEIRNLREDNAAQARAMVQLQQRLTKLMERWDGTGMPETRVVA